MATLMVSARAQQELKFPALSGRIVDSANIIAPAARISIEAKLAAHEATTSDQLVVATVPSLQGYAVEDYANRLFREWKLGEAKTNNGVLLLVAPAERKIRIEVGYGLEGALTDALSKIIITTAIAPKFKTGDFAGGIEAGVDGMLAILSKDADEWLRKAKVRPDSTNVDDILPVIIFVIFIAIFLSVFFSSVRNAIGRGGHGARWHRTSDGRWVSMLPGAATSWGSGTGGWGGGGSSGGFSGGGGSSGGGGASGDW